MIKESSCSSPWRRSSLENLMKIYMTGNNMKKVSVPSACVRSEHQVKLEGQFKTNENTVWFFFKH